MFEMPRDACHFQLSLLGINTINGGKEFLSSISFESEDLPAIPVNEYLPVFGHSKWERLRFKFSAFVNFAHKYKKPFLPLSTKGIVLKLGLLEVRLKPLFIFGTKVAPVGGKRFRGNDFI